MNHLMWVFYTHNQNPHTFVNFVASCLGVEIRVAPAARVARLFAMQQRPYADCACAINKFASTRSTSPANAASRALSRVIVLIACITVV